MGVTGPDVRPAKGPGGGRSAAAQPLVGPKQPVQARPAVPHKTPQGNGAPQVNQVEDSVAEPPSEKSRDSVESIATDVEQFTRDWVGRIRKLIHRSTQLVERESLLAGAIAKLNDQKSEWSKRTAERERSLKEQAERLTEAWLEVETERRKAIQGKRQSAAQQLSSGGAASGTQSAVVMPAHPTGMTPSSETIHSDTQQQPPGHESQASLEMDEGFDVETPNVDSTPNANRPVAIGPGPVLGLPLQNQPISTTNPGNTSRQKIEEFKRMQRAIRSKRPR